MNEYDYIKLVNGEVVFAQEIRRWYTTSYPRLVVQTDDNRKLIIPLTSVVYIEEGKS